MAAQACRGLTVLASRQRCRPVSISGHSGLAICFRPCSSGPATPSSSSNSSGLKASISPTLESGVQTTEAAGEGSEGGSQGATVDIGARTIAQLARDAEQVSSGGVKLSKFQRGGVGSIGTVLAAGGIGGFAWLHWPLLSPSSFCVIAGGCGGALLALAARGELPKSKEKPLKVKPLLEVKLLNDDKRFEGELASLNELETPRLWPKDVQLALASADTSAKLAKANAIATSEKTLLAKVQAALEAGADSEAVRRQFRPRLFVFDFKPGDAGLESQTPRGTKNQLELLRTQVSFILTSASEYDEALIRITSPGGAVAPYGLAAAQLLRLRDAGVKLTVCVDTVAASGGYMMACVGHRIVSAPFASLGSIGVIAGIPNVHKVLERNEVEFTQVTGGKYKRTVNVLTPNTEEGLAKFKQDVDEIHLAFKSHVSECRPTLDIEDVATGEVWLGTAALGRGLVDALGTSDDEIRMRVADGFTAIELAPAKPKKEGLAKLLGGLGGSGAEFAEVASQRASGIVKSLWRRAVQGVGSAASEARVEAPNFRNDH